MNTDVYVHLSRDDAEQLSLQRQEHAARHYAASLGLDVSTVYLENDVRAKNTRAAWPAYKRMLSDRRIRRS